MSKDLKSSPLLLYSRATTFFKCCSKCLEWWGKNGSF